MKKLLTLFSGLTVLPLLGQLVTACEKKEKAELLRIISTIKPLSISNITEKEIQEWCINWIQNVEGENKPARLDNEKLKNIILTNLTILAVARFIDEETKVEETIKQLKANNNNLDAILRTVEKISEEKIIKALMLVFLILQIENKDSAFECQFETSENQDHKIFKLTVKKANWENIKEKTNQVFIDNKKAVIEPPATELLNDFNLQKNSYINCVIDSHQNHF